MTTRSSTARRFLACLLAAVLVGVGAAGVATAATSHAGSTLLEADDPLANTTGESLDVLENETDESTGELDETTEALKDTGLVVRERNGRSAVNKLASDAESALSGAYATLEESEPESSPSMPADD